MQIELSFDEELLAKYKKRGAPPLFGIAWKCEGVFYPSDDWLDFGAVILSWWLVSAHRLLKGKDEDEFVFMDGPYSIKIKYCRQADFVQLNPSGLDMTWEVPFYQLAQELIRAANQVCRELIRTGAGARERTALEKGIADLRVALSKK
jgi:hypothetical protein